MQSINEALFYSLVKDDFVTAKKMLDAGANPNSIFQLQKNKFISCFNLFITKTASINQKKGTANTQYKSCMQLMKQIIPKSTLQCKCTKQHKCPLYIALETFKITEEKEILEGRGDVIRYLIIHGADVRFDGKGYGTGGNGGKGGVGVGHGIGKWKLGWFDIEGIRAYLVTKKFQFVEAKV